MNNSLVPLPVNKSGYITCHYMDVTNWTQIIRIPNIPGWYFEQTIFPKEQLIFFALPDALLEVHTSEMVTACVDALIPCSRLQCITPGKPEMVKQVAH